jgi:hypothetical protein
MEEKLNWIGNISNYYGGLHAWIEDGKYFWSIENYDGFSEIEEIPKYLYDALNRFQKESNG